MTTMPKNHWRVVVFAIIGVALMGMGLSLALFSNPRRFPINVEYDRYIHLFAILGFASTLVGILLFLHSVKDTTTSMPANFRNNTNIGVGLGFVLQLAGFFLHEFLQLRSGISLALVLAGLPAFIWGGMHYVQGKGHSQWLGLLAILGTFGFIVMILLPHRESSHSVNAGT
jgi:hypothetical protein